MMQPTQIDSTFIMPPEVACSLLIGRKISNTTRKRAMLARSKRVISYAPIVQDGPHSAFYNMRAALSPEHKLERKYSKLPLAKLQRISGRCAKLRVRLQRQYERTEEPKARQQLDLLAARVELMQECAEHIIAKRLRAVAVSLQAAAKAKEFPPFSIPPEAIAKAMKSASL